MAAIFAGALGAAGMLMSARANSASAKSQAYAQEYNATIADANAKATLEQTNAREEQQRRQFRSLQGEAIAGMAQSGTALNGSNLDVLKQNAINNELDALTIRYEGQMQSRGLMAQAQLDRYGADASRRNGRAAMTAGVLGAGASLLGGFANYSRNS